MKQILPFIAVLMFAASSLAQGPRGVFPIQCDFLGVDKYTVLDEAEYKFSYKLTCVIDTVEKKSIVNNLVLLVGAAYSKFFNIYPPHPEVKPGATGVHTDESRGLGATEVYKNFSNKKMTVTTRIYEPRADVFFYEEDIPMQAWTLTPESRKIHGYDCQKATTQYLGRDYTAWFTTKIPISNGPWKFGGLPGMILNVADAEGHYVFECTGIEQLTEKVPIVKYEFNYIKTTRTELNKVIKRMHDDLIAYIQSSDPNVRVHIREGATAKQPYNPIERE